MSAVVLGPVCNV